MGPVDRPARLEVRAIVHDRLIATRNGDVHDFGNHTSGSLTVTAPTSADAGVSVVATVDKPSVVVGESATETYTVSNTGPRAAEMVSLDIRLPEGGASIYNSRLATWTFDSCFGLWPVHCTGVTLAPGASMSLTVMVPEYVTGKFTTTAVVTWNGGTAAASDDVVVTPKTPLRHRAVPH
jgi:uncharacterized repeat protein (TIGR01451 family)